MEMVPGMNLLKGSGWRSAAIELFNMVIDSQSFNDISIFHPEEEYSIFHKLNFTRTTGGREWLRVFFSEPHNDIEKIKGTQRVIRTFMEEVHRWPGGITNGTILVMEKYLDYALEPISQNSASLNHLFYKWLHSEALNLLLEPPCPPR